MSARQWDKPKKRIRVAHQYRSRRFTQNPSINWDQEYNPLFDTGDGVPESEIVALDVIFALNTSYQTIGSILEIVQTAKNNEDEWKTLIQCLKESMSSLGERIALFEMHPPENRTADDTFSEPFIDYIELLEDMHDIVVDLKDKPSHSDLGHFKVFGEPKFDAEEVHRLNMSLEYRHRKFMEALGLFTLLRVKGIEKSTNSTNPDVETTETSVKATKRNTERIITDADSTAILLLPTVESVASSVHRSCLPGTRQAVLQTLWQWADDDTSGKPIFWLCDIAGSGKSTVAMSAGMHWQGEGLLGGQFFFSIASSEGSTTEKFCSTIARELVQHIPELALYVAQAIKRNPSWMRRSLHEQLQTLVLSPLRHLRRPVILVIDALDECKSGLQRRELVESLSKAVLECRNLKILMTSRPDPVVESSLRPLSIKAVLVDRLHDVNHNDNVDDIALFVHQVLDGLLPVDKREKLVAKSNGLFIWASTVCRMLINEIDFKSPEAIYDQIISLDQPGAIDGVYDLIFERIDANYRAFVYEILALLVVAFDPLTTDDLDDILKHARIRGSTMATINNNLRRVLMVDPRTNFILFRHPTVVEYLRRRYTASKINNTNELYIDVAKAHGQAASWCLKCLKSRTDGLKFNICQFVLPFYLNRQIADLHVRVPNFISRRLRYASSHWLCHIAEADDHWRRTAENELQYILQSSGVLYWMEVLSLIGGVPRGIAGLQAVIPITGIEEETRDAVIETYRFLSAFSPLIQASAPHVYISALSFPLRKRNIHIEPRVFQDQKIWTTAIELSRDGSRIVSASSDRTIRLWDANTDQPLGEPFRGHQESALTLAFSRDGSKIASGSSDKVIRIWNVNTGQQMGRPFQGHKGSVWAIAFSPDGSLLVSASEDNTIQIWDVESGRPSKALSRRHKDLITSVAFSPDGSLIVSVSEDKIIRLWDVYTGSPWGELLQGQPVDAPVIAISSDGSRIISGLHDNTIGVWDGATGQPLGEPLQGHKAGVWAIAFSSDNSRMASGSCDNTIRIWDIDAGQPVGEPLIGHEGPIMTVVFSPDNSLIASGSADKSIRLWNSDTGQPMAKPLCGHDSSVTAVAFSPDGSAICSRSSDHTVRLWKLWPGRNGTSQEQSESADIRYRSIPGFMKVPFDRDGCVQTCGKFLFWVPREDQYGRKQPHAVIWTAEASLLCMA
ncbi:SubName: Full=Related to WD40-repeat protein (Notchless protein) {ECO:0000313/EMBL:CCA75040.1} [Serendipita indica DSM 11827]|nr:SubName: Full=Related to WD40-repeat protein (Notchless protein) {ECO:0000313/EMBL:CCA75040.1} [Serendipita indica DSM 11827]